MPKKGSNFEREFCDLLSAWWTGERDERVFWRSSNSGGTATVRGRKGKKTTSHCGDVTATCKESEPFTKLITLELKRGYNRSTSCVGDLLDCGEKSAVQEFEAWIAQARDAAERAGTPYWMIVQRRDQRVACVYFPVRLLDVLSGLGAGFDSPGLYLSCRVRRKSGKAFRAKMVGMRLGSFLAGVTPEHVFAAYQLHEKGRRNAS